MQQFLSLHTGMARRLKWNIENDIKKDVDMLVTFSGEISTPPSAMIHY